jgi:hypothetical protein
MVQRDFGDMPPAIVRWFVTATDPQRFHLGVVFRNRHLHFFGLPVPDLEPNRFSKLGDPPGPFRANKVPMLFSPIGVPLCCSSIVRARNRDAVLGDRGDAMV